MGNHKNQLILGVDPGLRTSGVVLMENKELLGAVTLVISQREDDSYGFAMSRIYAHMNNLCFRDKPVVAGIEQDKVQRNAKTTRSMAYAEAAFIIWCQDHGVPAFLYGPKQARKKGLGFGGDKAYAFSRVSELYPDHELNQHECDAVVLALAVATTLR